MEDIRSSSTFVVAAICIALSTIVSYAVSTQVLERSGQPAFISGPASKIATMKSTVDIADVVEAAQPSVVAITVEVDEAHIPKKLKEILPEPDAREVAEKRRVVSSGSGFFVSQDGLVVTNKHVVEMPDVPNASRHVSLALNTGERFAASVVALDPIWDIALLRVSDSTSTRPVLTFASSSQVRVGQTVVAIGNALSDFPNTVTQGVVSGLNRRVWAGDDFGDEVLEEAIQTDAAINPGNSGGPLLDVFGRVIGMNTAVAENGQSLGFALPAEAILRSVESVQRYGRVIRPFLGVRYELREEGGADIVRGTEEGEDAIAAGSPAEKAGLLEGDVLISIAGVPIDDLHTPIGLIEKYKVGDILKVVVLRKGEEKTFFIPLAEYNP